MNGHTLRGLAASPGVAAGRVLPLEQPELAEGPHRGGAVEFETAAAALDHVANELAGRARHLRADGLVAEAEILEANRLMALDPLLRADVEGLAEELTAPAALRTATERHAALLARLADPLLAARASDIRELGRRAVRRLTGGTTQSSTSEPAVLVADDLGPADVADLRESDVAIVGVVLGAGAATSHAAIMARSLGLPMVVGAGELSGDSIVVDGDTGLVHVDPDPARWAWGVERMAERAGERERFARERHLPAVTRDGRAVTLLGNAATAPEVRAGIAAEAEGVGLLRTELAFLEATAWPTEEDHVVALAPLLGLLQARTVTVRVLDFGSDKTPPFLAGTGSRGLALLFERPDALAAQLRAILRTAGTARLRILLPLVEYPSEVREVRALLRVAARDVGWNADLPPLGAMIETPHAAGTARDIALEADFLSLGTNDLVQYTLNLDRTEPLATARSAAHPEVLELIAGTVAAAHMAGLTVEICGESASVPELAALYVGLGVDELSVAPARLDELRAVVRGVVASEAEDVSQRALEAESASAVLAMAARLLRESGDEQREVLGGLGGVVA